MKSAQVNTWARRYAVAVGLLDFVTGIALLVAPDVTLAAMGASSPDRSAQVFVRFVGVFVATVGASYLHGAREPGEAFRTMLRLTRLFRLGAGGFTGIAVLAGGLEPAWYVVTATDLACVLVQSWFLQKGAGRDV